MPDIQQQQKRIMSQYFVYELKMLDPTYSHVEIHRFFENRKSLMQYLNSELNLKICEMTVNRMSKSGGHMKRHPRLQLERHPTLLREPKNTLKKRNLDDIKLPYDISKLESVPYKCRGITSPSYTITLTKK